MARHAVVTGGNKGIGLSVTRRLLEGGARITVIARSFEGFALQGHPGVTTRVYDLSDLEGIPALAAGLGDVDVLVNNAGVMLGAPFQGYPPASQQLTMRVNLEAPVALITALAETLCARQARVVNLASIAGQIGHPDVWYGISKAGLINATKSFARLLGPRGVVINAVAPGPVETAMLATIPEARRAAVKASTYAGRFATPDEVADVVVWLAGDAPAYLNGVCIDLNNGFFPR